jgi:hypothetical protein
MMIHVKMVAQIKKMIMANCKVYEQATSRDYYKIPYLTFAELWAYIGNLYPFLITCKCDGCSKLVNRNKTITINNINEVLELLKAGTPRALLARYFNINIECADRIVDAYTELYQLLGHEHTTTGKCACKRVI